jgi:hypothetical protein
MLVITLMQAVYNHVPETETNHVSRFQREEVFLYLQLVLQVMLFRP